MQDMRLIGTENYSGESIAKYTLKLNIKYTED